MISTWSAARQDLPLATQERQDLATLKPSSTMQIFSEHRFDSDSFLDHQSRSVFADVRFERCYFQGCGIGRTRDAHRRVRIRNAHLVNCEMRGCTLGPALLEDCLVDGLKTNGLRPAYGAAYKHVTLRGRIDHLLLGAYLGLDDKDGSEALAFAKSDAEFYASVDWALDISELDCVDLDIRTAPAHLVRIDPETQVVVTREQAMRREWARLDLGERWPRQMDVFLNLDLREDVFVVGKRDKKDQKARLRGIELLRREGIAEPAFPVQDGAGVTHYHGCSPPIAPALPERTDLPAN